MTLSQIIQRFLKKPTYLQMGAGKLSKIWGCTKEEIYLAKVEARKLLAIAEEVEAPVVEAITESAKDEDIPKYVGSEKTSEGNIKKFESSKPLSPKEIEELSGVDNVNTYISRVVDKLMANGKWTYAIDIKFRVKDFYNKKELDKQIKSILANVSPHIPLKPFASSHTKKALMVCLADDHVGIVNVTNVYGSPVYSYKERLSKILEEILLLNEMFDEVHIISLGDQLNGWNSQTTRGGHEVKSLSNKDQFDIYVSSRIEFYEKLFTSGISSKYFLHDVDNSNHSGNGFSYMANRTLAIYLEQRFPNVKQYSITDALSTFTYGKHVIAIGHGKEEKYQIRPMPLTLNQATDLYLYDYFHRKGFKAYDNFLTFYKGDLHQHSIQNGKFGRYVNVQSLAGGGDYSDINFGYTKAGALLEIFNKDSYHIRSQPIWF